MRVLMFGWEFPPHIAGGLGTACYGMTKGLAYNDVDVLFVMPSASGDEDESSVKIINASDVAIDTVTIDTDSSCKLTHGHHLVGCHHTLCLEGNHACIHLVVARTVI